MSEQDSALGESGDAGEFGATTPARAPLARLVRARVLQRFAALRHGRLTLVDALGSASFGTPGATPDVTVRIRDLSAWADIARGGTIGAAEAYMDGLWTASDLVGLVRLFVRNRDMMNGVEGGLARLGAPLLRLAHRRRRNTETGSRANIRAHYDLGNDFYRLFLDAPTMSYSAGIWPHAEATLAEAASHKLDVVCRKLELRPGDHLLEIGTGWGGLALHAAQHYGCRVTTTTLSAEQRRYALGRIAAAGLADRVTVLDQDYRRLTGRYDKLVSVEMIEAVGLDHLDEYFRVCSERLLPHGRMVLQAIVIADRLYDEARRSVDFIQKYVFPGGALPSIAAMQDAIARRTDLQLVHLQEIGEHYARTLREWRSRFLGELAAVRRLGHSEQFIRMWEYYLAYCEGGFLERAIGDVQLVLDKPDSRLPAVG